jgi:hypothetical protein
VITVKPKTPEQIRTQQKADAEKDAARIKAALPAIAEPAKTAVAVPDNRSSVQKYIDDVAPATIAGRVIRFGKEGKFVTPDDGTEIGDDIDFIALVDETQVGWIRFNGEGEPPDRVMGLLYDGFVMPARETLGDEDPAGWNIGLNGRPEDPWQSQINLVLQRADTQELFTYSTSSQTGRRAVGHFLRHYDRLRRGDQGFYPIIRLKVGGFNHRDDRVGWVKTPVLAVVGRAPKEGTAKPDSSIGTDMNDGLPF